MDHSPWKPSLKPSLVRIFWTDYLAFFFSLVPVSAWVIYFAWIPDWKGDGSVIPPRAAPFYMILAIVATLTSLAVFAWRLWLIYSVFKHGANVKGKITSVFIKRDRGRVEYTYIFDRKEYQTGVEIHRNERTKALKEGEHVDLLVDCSNPKRAFIRHLYTAEERDQTLN